MPDREAVVIVIAGLLPLVIAGLIVWQLTRRRRGGAASAGWSAHELRTALQHAATFVAMVVTAVGLSRVVTAALPVGQADVRTPTEIALGVALTVVALPCWLLLWRAVTRRAAVSPVELATPTWALHLVAAVTVSVVVVFVQIGATSTWLLGLEPYRPAPIGWLLVWGAVWAGHTWVLERSPWRPTSPAAELAGSAGAVIGLVGTAVGAGAALAGAFGWLYRTLTGADLIAPSLRETVGVGLVTAATGAAIWWWHWIREVRDRDRDVLWLAHVLLLGVLGGTATAVVGTAVALHAALQWLVGEPMTITAVAHFDVLAPAAAALLVGLALRGYHRWVLLHGVPAGRSEPERVHDHLLSAVGLVTTTAGATLTVVAALTAAAGAAAGPEFAARDALALALTLLLVGTPLWVVTWRRLERLVTSDGAVELASPTRRSYLVLVLGASGLTAAVGLAVTLFVVLRDALEERLGAATLLDARVAIGLLLATSAVAGYHLAVHRRDRASAPPPPPPPPQVRHVLLISPDGRELVSAVADATGARVDGLHRLDGPEHPVDAAPVTAAVLASPDPRIVVTVDDDGEVHVIPVGDA